MTVDPVYPIGKYTREEIITADMRAHGIQRIASLPAQLKTTATALTADHLEKSYRSGGWTARQIIHHLADSHMHMYARLKLALTEENPVIKPYDQDKWAEIPEAKGGDIRTSLELLTFLHVRIVATLQDMADTDFERTYFHPEQERKVSLAEVVMLYAWHGDHHLGQIRVILGG